MDPLNPITPAQDFLASVTRAPAVPRVSPDEQRDRTRDERQQEQDADEEESFEHMLEDVTEDGPQVPVAIDPGDSVIADAVTVTGGSLDVSIPPGADDRYTDGADERRDEDAGASGPDDDEGAGRHIDITA